jgi:hypothetical protein
MKPHRVIVLLVSLVVGAPGLALAQLTRDGTDAARFRFGPLALTPRLAIQNLGVDTNVFNSPSDPVRDTTVTIAPGADAWLRFSRVLVTSKTTSDWIYYQKAASQRSFNIIEDWRIDIDLLRATPRITGLYLRTRQRLNDEVDARVQQKHVAGGVGITIPAGSRLTFDLDARRTRYDFSQGAHGDPTLAEALNRDTDHATVAGRVELTPLTSITVKAESIRDRFAFSPERDSDSIRVMPGVTFQPFAVISGSAFVGYRRFDTLSPAVPNFSGVVASVELKYVLLDVFRVVGRVKRDIDYSLDLDEPFFVSTSVGAEVLQAIGLNWDVVGRVRRGALAYQQVTPGQPGRIDRMYLVGTGLGRRLGQDLRIGFDVDFVKRTSALESRTFEGLRFGGSLTYGY